MSVQVPVYNDHHGYHQIKIYSQVDDGEFRRTPKRMMSHLLVNFDSISEPLGEVIAPMHDPRTHVWNSPTVYFHLGRPTSFYQFLREHALKRTIMVLSTQSHSVRVRKFTVHELRFSRNASTAVKALTARKFLDEINVHLIAPYEATVQNEAQLQAGLGRVVNQ